MSVPGILDAGDELPVPDRAWTAEQRRAITRRQGDLLLDAGAGSGKTSVLAERFARSVLVDDVPVGAILAITFTEKAADELRDRIRARLLELGAEQAARQTEAAFISTIHGFCARVLRAQALAAGLDPGFVVLDRYESGPLAGAAFAAALEGLAAADPAAVELVAAYGAGSLRAAVTAASAKLRSAGFAEPRLPEVAPPDDDGADALRRTATALAAELHAISEASPTVEQTIDRVRACVEVAADGAGAVWPAALSRLRLPRNGAALGTDACVAYAEALEVFREAAGAIAARPVRDLLDRLLSSYTGEYERRKRAVSGVDFEDLELITLRLLTDDRDLATRYASRFASIMVDELQDTNPVQLALIEAIARDNLFTVGDVQQSIYGFRHADCELFARRGERLAAIGARETLRTNFRSRPEILRALNHAFAGELGAAFMPLEVGRDVTPALDPRVEMLMVDKGADWELEGIASPWRLAEARLLADRIAELVAQGTAPGEIVVLMRATTDMRAYERALERRGLPTYVIGGRGYWSHPQVIDLVAYLRALANPREEEALYGTLVSPLVGVSLDAVVILADAARAAARDPWWMLREPGDVLRDASDADRERLTSFAGWFATQRVRAARASIEELIEAALRDTGYDLAMLAMPGGPRRLANVRKLMRLGHEHESRHGPDLRGFIASVADRTAGRSPEVREGEAPVEGESLDAIRMMTIHRAKGLEFPCVVVADLGRSPRPPGEILRVTADGRLGLRLARPGAGGRESVLEYRALGEEARVAQEAEERRLHYVAMTRARERLVLSGAAKFDGFLEPGGRTGGGPIAWIAPAFAPDLAETLVAGGGVVSVGGARIAVRIGRPQDACCADSGVSAGDAGALAVDVPAVDVPAADLPRVDVPAADVPAADLPAAPAGPVAGGVTPDLERAPAVAALSYSSLGEYVRCGYRFYAERVLGLPSIAAAPRRAADSSEPPGPRGASDIVGPPAPRSAADRGVLVHLLLEGLDFRRPVIPSAVAVLAAAEHAGVRPPPGPGECDELIALVRAFCASELCTRLGRATDVRREERFAFALHPDPAQPLIVGALDVLAREPGGVALVVDYKSDRLGAADPERIVAESYGTQRLVYALAALRGGAREVEIAHCFLERPQAPVVVRVTADRRAELEAELRSLTADVLAQRFPVSPEPCRALCAGCPAEDGLCSWPPEMTRRAAPDTLF